MSESISVGDVLEGTVTRTEQYGLFVDVNGIPGLIRVSELSWGPVNHPSDVARIGERVQFQVLNLNNAIATPHEHFNASIKLLLPPGTAIG